MKQSLGTYQKVHFLGNFEIVAISTDIWINVGYILSWTYDSLQVTLDVLQIWKRNVSISYAWLNSPIMFPRTLTTGMLCKRNPTTYFIGKRIGIKIFFLRKLLSTQYSEKILQMGPYSLMSPYKETTVGKFIIVCNCLS